MNFYNIVEEKILSYFNLIDVLLVPQLKTTLTGTQTKKKVGLTLDTNNALTSLKINNNFSNYI